MFLMEEHTSAARGPAALIVGSTLPVRVETGFTILGYPALAVTFVVIGAFGSSADDQHRSRPDMTSQSKVMSVRWTNVLDARASRVAHESNRQVIQFFHTSVQGPQRLRPDARIALPPQSLSEEEEARQGQTHLVSADDAHAAGHEQ